MSKKICCATTVLMDAETAASEIDRVLNETLYQSQPGYIGIPTNIWYTNISSPSLKTPLKTELPGNDCGVEEKAVTQIRGLIETSSKPVIVVDRGATRNLVFSEVETLCEVTNFPSFSNPWGKGAVSEASDRFGGLYYGARDPSQASKKPLRAPIVFCGLASCRVIQIRQSLQGTSSLTRSWKSSAFG